MTVYISGKQECLDATCRSDREMIIRRTAARLDFLRGVPETYRDARLTSVAQPTVPFPAALENILLLGKSGRGKTYAAVAWVLYHVERKGWGACWYEVPMLLARFRASFRDGAKQSELDIIREVEKPDIIILDDLGAEKASDYSAQSLYCILSRRVNEGKTTVVTTNLTMAELHAAEPRIASRLAGFHVIGITGDDRRMSRVE